MNTTGAARTGDKNFCPQCKKNCNGATSETEQGRMPVEGDLSVCLYCAAMLTYDKDIKLSALSIMAFGGLSEDDKQTLLKLRTRILANKLFEGV